MMVFLTKVKPYAITASDLTLSDSSDNSENENDSKNVIDYFQTHKNKEKVPDPGWIIDEKKLETVQFSIF